MVTNWVEWDSLVKIRVRVELIRSNVYVCFFFKYPLRMKVVRILNEVTYSKLPIFHLNVLADEVLKNLCKFKSWNDLGLNRAWIEKRYLLLRLVLVLYFPCPS